MTVTAVCALLGAAYTGTTLATSLDGIEMPGFTIISGNLASERVGDTTWEAHYPDGTTQTISDPDTALITPGTTLNGTSNVDVALEGDNMKARMKIGLTNNQGNPVNPANYGITMTYTVEQTHPGGNTIVVPTTNFNATAPPLLLDTTTGFPEGIDGNTDYVVKTTIIFPTDLADAAAISDLSSQLGEMTVDLEQARS